MIDALSRRLERQSALRLADGVASADVVIIGSGVAGLTAALSLVPRRVTLITKRQLASGSSRWAQGGIAAAMGVGDDPSMHADDTLEAGAGLCDEDLVRDLIADAPEHIRRLVVRGVRFDRRADGELSLGREGAHSAHRVLHCGGDATGAEMVRALVEALVAEQRADGRIGVSEDTFAEDLVVEDGRVVGVLARHGDGRRVLHRAGAVILATGGCGQLWAKTTNPPEATGDGLAMAARAGAVLADLEMIQFHPTALDIGDHGGASLPLLTEALRGEGAILVDASGHRFMPAIDPRSELAPRDIVSRAIWRRTRAGGGGVFLDARAAVGQAFPSRFPTVWRHCRDAGIDPRSELMPVTPAAHYAMAGVDVDAVGRTSLEGLWACGEVTSSGLHGANRLASNSLLEGVIYGARVAEDIAGTARRLAVSARGGLVMRRCSDDASGVAAVVRTELRHLAWRDLGLERDRTGLERALERFGELSAPASDTFGGETANLLLIGRLVAAAALARRESRGAHFRIDRPEVEEALAERARFTYAPDSDAFPLLVERETFERSAEAERREIA